MNVAEANMIRGKLLFDEPMSKHTSWRVGGVAEQYFVPADLQDLQQYLYQLEKDIELSWIGLGSNLLVRDGGIRGVTIAPLNKLKSLEMRKDGCVYAEAGVTCAKLARFCRKQGLSGADFFAGIPGTVGGALAMNAGAFGSETWSFVSRLTMINRQGELVNRFANEFEVDYRRVDLPAQEWFAAGYFLFPSKAPEAESNIRGLLKKRNDSQPIGLPSCGSVFKNPAGDFAARLIESAGLKGYCQGGACVSQKHANFIISDEQTHASDIEDLIHHIQQTVKQHSGISLHTEVRILGEKL